MQPEVTSTKSPRTRRAFLGLGIAAVLGSAGIAIFVGMAAVTEPAIAADATEISYMDPDAAHKAALAGEIILIDIRRPDEWLDTNVAEGAIGLDMRADDFVPTLVALRRANPDTPIALICRTGNRTGHVTRVLANQGFPGLVDVDEGMEGGRNGPGWLKRGLPTYAGTPENVVIRTKLIVP